MNDFCIECHTGREIAAMESPLIYRAGIYDEKHSPCPGVRKINLDLFLAESRIIKTLHALEGFGKKHRYYVAPLEKRLREEYVKLSQLKDGHTGLYSAGIVGSELGRIRFRANKAYQEFNRARDEVKMRVAVGVVTTGLALVFFFVLLGIKNALKEEE